MVTVQGPDKGELSSLIGGISKIIHQSWHSDVVPSKFRPWSMSWRENHPDWEWYLWTDEDNRNLVAQEIPSFLPTYDSFPKVECILHCSEGIALMFKAS